MNKLLCAVRQVAYAASFASTLLAMGSSTAYAKSSVPEEEVQALWGLYTFTNGSSWTRKDNWGFDTDFTSAAQPDPCTFYGVVCKGGHVTELDLSLNNLDGVVLPRVILQLPYLQNLNLAANQLRGAIPKLSGHIALQYLHLEGNELTGSIPPLPNSLQGFWAGNNQLSGSIPLLPNSLLIFSVYGNQLTGSIPPLPNSLLRFDASNNQLLGSIPLLPNSLLEFSAPKNQLTGPIPALPASLQAFNAHSNQLTGSIPPLPNSLIYFSASGNQLTGLLPAIPPNLAALYVEDNWLDGELPAIPAGSPMLMYGAGSALVCPNNFVKVILPDWDDVTGMTPWYGRCR